MSEGDSKQVNVISTRTVRGRQEATIEVSSCDSLIEYSASHFNQLTHVRISSSVLQAERDVIIEVCKVLQGLRYDAGDNKEGTGDDEKKEGEKKEDNEKAGQKKRDREGEKKA